MVVNDRSDFWILCRLLLLNMGLAAFLYSLSIKYMESEYTRLGLLTIRDMQNSARVHKHPLPHPLCNRYLKENDQVSAEFTINLLKTF